MSGVYYFLIAQSLVLAFFIIRTYTTGYLSEKGKGLATKQDIGEITNKIEEVRIEYNSKLELTKASIQLDLFSNQHFLQKSTEILLKYYDTLMILSHDNLSVNFGDLAGGNIGEALLKFQKDTSEKFISLKVDYHRLLIFMDGQEKIMTDCMKILEISIRLRKIFDNHFSKIKLSLLNESEKFLMPKEEYFKACQETDIVVKKYYAELKDVKNEFNDRIGLFISSLMDYFKQKNLLNY